MLFAPPSVTTVLAGMPVATGVLVGVGVGVGVGVVLAGALPFCTSVACSVPIRLPLASLITRKKLFEPVSPAGSSNCTPTTASVSPAAMVMVPFKPV